jgi:hypothetical protein
MNDVIVECCDPGTVMTQLASSVVRGLGLVHLRRLGPFGRRWGCGDLLSRTLPLAWLGSRRLRVATEVGS